MFTSQFRSLTHCTCKFTKISQAKAVHTQDVTTFEREIVRAVHVQVGDRVKKGQTVVSLLAADRTARAQASRTGYDEAQLNYKRLNELRKKGGVSQAEVDKAYAALKSVEAGLRSSQSTLLRTELKASIDGIVSARNVEPGEVAEMGKPLVPDSLLPCPHIPIYRLPMFPA